MNVKSQTRRGMRLAEHAVTDLLSRTRISVHSTNDNTRQKDRDKGEANRASTERMIRQNAVERGLLNHTLGDMESRASTSASKGDKEQNGHCR